MYYFRIFTLLCICTHASSGCNGNRRLPDVSEIESIHLSLNDPEIMSHWNYEGNVPEQHWAKLMAHLKPATYKGDLAKWEGLGVIEIRPKHGATISIEVYLTHDSVGCYKKRGGYFTIDDEVVVL